MSCIFGPIDRVGGMHDGQRSRSSNAGCVLASTLDRPAPDLAFIDDGRMRFGVDQPATTQLGQAVEEIVEVGYLVAFGGGEFWLNDRIAR